MRPYRGSDGWISVGYPYAPCPTGPRSMAQKSSKGQLMLCRKLSDKNRKEWNSFLFLPSIFIYRFRYRPHRKKLFRLDEASGTRSTSPARRRSAAYGGASVWGLGQGVVSTGRAVPCLNPLRCGTAGAGGCRGCVDQASALCSLRTMRKE